MADITQSHFRFGKDDGTESSHTFWQLEDVDHTQEIAANWTFLLRFCEQVTTAVSNVDAQFQYNRNGAGWVNITTTSSIVKAVAVAAFTNGQNCTKRLSGTGTFEISGAGCTEDGLSGGNANDIVLNGNSETEAGLQVVYADVASGDTIQFRLTSPDGTMVYSVTPTLTVTKASTTNYKAIPATAVGTAIISRKNSFYRTVIATAIGVAVLTKVTTFYKAILATAVDIAVISTAKMFSKAIDAVAQGIVTLSKITTYRQLVSATTVGVSGLTKTASHYLTLVVSAVGIPQLIKSMSQILSATAQGIATLTNVLTASRTLTVTAVGLVVLSRSSEFSVNLVAITQGMSGLVTQFIGGATGFFGILKRWTGVTWARAKLRVWLNETWRSKPLKIWDGESWKEVDKD